MSNKLTFEKQKQLLHLMVEGNSIRGIARLLDISPVTVLRHLEIAGSACLTFHDDYVKGLQSKRIECDEIWSFNYCKEKNLESAKAAPEKAGTVWTWTAIDVDTKLIASFYIGDRDAASANAFMTDVASRLSSRVQLSTDGHKPYLEAVETAFGDGIDYAQLVKKYGSTPEDKRERYIGADRTPIVGKPNPKTVSTSCIEKHNQTMRQHMRRFTRKTACHSKKFINHVHMVSLYTTWYNWARINSAIKMTPAMASGLTMNLWELDDLVKMVRGYEDKNPLTA